MTCYICHQPAEINIIFSPEEVFSCEDHFRELFNRFIRKKKVSICDLSQTVDSWENVTHKGQGDSRRHKITRGKMFEIENRVRSKDDPSVVINRVTGREAQY